MNQGSGKATWRRSDEETKEEAKYGQSVELNGWTAQLNVTAK